MKREKECRTIKEEVRLIIFIIDFLKYMLSFYYIPGFSFCVFENMSLNKTDENLKKKIYCGIRHEEKSF